MRFLDANVFIRLLTRDDEEKAQACFALFQGLRSGDVTATTSESVIAEVVYVLSSRTLYNLPTGEIRKRLQPILALRGLKITGKRRFLRALEIYESYPRLDFEDALTVSHMEHDGIAELVSYDRGFDRVPHIRRIEPLVLSE